MNQARSSSLRYAGAGNGNAIVLLHPIAMRLEFWAPVAERLARTNRVISLDLRGHGENARSHAPFTIADLADDVVALAHALDLRQAVFVGCSLGGMVAQAVALGAPELVSGLVLANTTHTMTEQSRGVMLQRAKAAGEGLEQTVDADIERWFSPSYRTTQIRTVDLVRRWVLANDKNVVANGWRAIASLDHREAVAAIDCPVIVTTGSLDPAAPSEQARAMARDFRRARFEEIPNAGHFSPLERPDAFAEIVRSVQE